MKTRVHVGRYYKMISPFEVGICIHCGKKRTHKFHHKAKFHEIHEFVDIMTAQISEPENALAVIKAAKVYIEAVFLPFTSHERKLFDELKATIDKSLRPIKREK